MTTGVSQTERPVTLINRRDCKLGPFSAINRSINGECIGPAAPFAGRIAGIDMSKFLLTLKGSDQPGIVAAISGALFSAGCNILDSAQFFDPEPRTEVSEGKGKFFMRVEFSAPEGATVEELQVAFGLPARKFHLDIKVYDEDRKARLIIMVSKQDHCLQDLLYRVKIGALYAEVVAIVSNHEDSAETARLHGIPYYFWPVDQDNKAEQEARLLALYREADADLLVLARYMQILSKDISTELFGHIINIHHSFLPAFKGARPYQRAHERGVKLIGATAHYVTPDLDEGPIIEQDIERVSHASTSRELMAAGRDIEARVLARAVRYHIERRIFVHGVKTVVFA